MASQLIRVSSYEAHNQLELSLSQAFDLLQSKLRPPFSLTIPDPQEYTLLNQAILYGVLIEPHFAKIHIKHLHAIVIDGYKLFLSLLVGIVNELYGKLVDSVKEQLIWVTKEMIDVSATGIDSLLVSLMRQIVGGDFSDGNLWLCFELASLCLSKWDCLLQEKPVVLTSALYTFLRLLADHCRVSNNLKLEMLRQMEIEFCVKMLRDQFQLCLKIGRDLVRLLQDLFHVPEFKSIWKDLVLSPSEFRTAEYLDISQLYCIRTSTRYFLLRITPEMETQLRFLLTHVMLGNQKRYQIWFENKFLLGPERESLIVDIVRFICCAHHPSNEIIQSNIIPRWAVIGWLLACCKKKYIEANGRLALFFDWLFFNEKVDNIMNIEPAMLLMVCSLPKYVNFTHSLLEFLLLLVDNYDLDRKTIILRGVSSAFNSLVQKGVVHSLDVLTRCDVLSPFIRERLQNLLLNDQGKVPRDLLPVDLPGHSTQSLRLPDMSCMGNSTQPTQEQFTSEGDDGLSTRVVVVPGGNEVDSIERLVESIGDIIKESYARGLQTLEAILFSIVNQCNQRNTSNSICSEDLLSKITKEFESNGYRLFTSLGSLAGVVECDDEICSATAVIIRTFIFSQNERIQEMLLLWARNGFPVGARLLSYALRLAHEAYAADLSICEEDIIRLLVDKLDYVDLTEMQFQIGLKKFSLFGDNHKLVFHLIKNSLNWNSVEQHKLWGLIRSELPVSEVQVEKIILEFFCSGKIDVNLSAIAAGGLLTLCSSCAPTSALVGTIMSLPNNFFQDFAAAALATWAASNASMLFDSITEFAEKLKSCSIVCLPIPLNLHLPAVLIKLEETKACSKADITSGSENGNLLAFKYAISETAKAASNCSWLWTTHCGFDVSEVQYCTARLSIFYVHLLKIIAMFCM
ncbi:hypothetical protein GOBAR_AA38308 [Gossypium barbadense]|uniref:Integrator complex subunit 3 n=1 Tax=Gossypium barbadense TaxID=3634 RepID=A0A2P5VUA3_GOSBA|nr:hypothetical protein GOBAR_AA38308 [Gossypium barbadense]